MSQRINSLSYNRNNKYFNLYFQNKNQLFRTVSLTVLIYKKQENQISCNNLIRNNIYNKIQISLGKKKTYPIFLTIKIMNIALLNLNNILILK